MNCAHACLLGLPRRIVNDRSAASKRFVDFVLDNLFGPKYTIVKAKLQVKRHAVDAASACVAKPAPPHFETS
jgi:hypothetical protein